MIRFKIDQETTEILQQLTKLYKFEYETVTMRIAFALSISNEKKFSDEDQASGGNGREFSPTSNIFGHYINDENNETIYYAVLCQHYDRELTNQDFARLYKLHLCDGLQYWSDEIKVIDTLSGGHIKYLAKMFNKGLLSNSSPVKTASYKPKIDIPAYDSLLTFSLGQYEDGHEADVRLNDLMEFDNRNIAIAGMAGSGKTQLIKDILYQISQNTNHQLKFTFFDYKGEGDSNSLTTFLGSTQCQFIDIINDGGIDFNPLLAIQTDPNQKVFSIRSFVETIATFTPDIGISQKSILTNIISDLIDKLDGSQPTIEQLFNSIKEHYKENNKKQDSLYAAIENLSSNLFNCDNKDEVLLNESLYINLPAMLSDSLRQLIVFLILRYIVTYYSSTNDCKPNDNIFPLRHIIVIDEAHIYLKNKNASTALEEMLRLLRSKGVVVIMLSQGAEDYKTKSFDFVSQVKIPICLNIQNKDYKTIEHFLGTPKSSIQLQEAIDQLSSGKAIINLREPLVFNIAQWWKTEARLESNY